jgi:hypothetical protein
MSGMIVPAAEKGYRYFITFIDDLSRYSWVYFTERKDEKSIAEKYEEWRAEAENKLGNVVSYLQTDEGGEYEKEMGTVLKRSGTTHLTSPPYSHQSNGLAEILNRKLKDSARTMMIHAKLPQAFWSKAIVFANEISNTLPRKATGKIPYEIFFDPSLDRYKVVGCIIEPLVDEETRPAQSMWDKRANRQVYVGTDSRSGYQYWDLTSRRFVHTHNCTFFENEFSSPDEFPTLRMEPRTRKQARVPAVPPVLRQERQPQQQVPPKSREQELMQDTAVPRDTLGDASSKYNVGVRTTRCRETLIEIRTHEVPFSTVK